MSEIFAFLFRILAGLMMQLLVEFVFYYMGKMVVFVSTLGHWRVGDAAKQNEISEDTACLIGGFVCLSVIGTCVFYFW